MRGAAEVFGFRGLGNNAKAVERAATAALRDSNGERRTSSVAATMLALSTSLADEIRSGMRASAT